MARSSEPFGHLGDRVIVDATFDDHVHLDGHARRSGGVDTVQHGLCGESNIVHGHKHIIIDRVEADRHPLEAGRGEGLGFAL